MWDLRSVPLKDLKSMSDIVMCKPRFYGAFGHMFGAQIRVQCTSDNVLVALSITHSPVCFAVPSNDGAL